ncbi:hypothetical protein ILYODFUR_007543, partial [Ilyodon furcidens]
KLSVPCPPSNASTFTLNLSLDSPSSLKQHQINLLNNSCVVSPDSEYLNPWRLDYSYILAIYQYQFQNISHLSLFKKINLLHNLVSSSECFSACGSELS